MGKDNRVRLIDYPRRAKRGVRRWLPSWKLVLGTSATVVAGVVAALPWAGDA